MLPLRFKEAVDENELEQIHALNHRIFAEEIAQHKRRPSGLLIDRFHAQNRYFIAVRNGVVIGMISAHAGPEFSIGRRLPDASILNDFPRPIEIRLLAIEPKERNRTVLAGLLWQAYDFAVGKGFSHLLISAIATREQMYCRLGFRHLGPAVADGSASFIPMVMAIDVLDRAGRDRAQLHERHWRRRITSSTKMPAAEPISLLPGPVVIHPRVARAFASAPISHRSAVFVDAYERVRSHLCTFLPGMEVALFPGAGTLANDAVAANLHAIFGDAKGLVLSNGEFGDRLVTQALRAGLHFERLTFPYGSAWSLEAIAGALQDGPAWIWVVQVETSTGVLNDVEDLLRLAQSAGCAVALDCVSSIGAVPIAADGSGLLLASGVSGKSLGAYAGLAFVYLSPACRSALSDRTLTNGALCPSFDLLRMQQSRGPVSTIASSTLLALASALERSYASPEAVSRRFEEYRLLGQYVRGEMRRAGLLPLASDTIAAPHITTFELPYPSFPKECLRAGYVIAHESPYLQSRGWGQIATMGDITKDTLAPFFAEIGAQRR